MGETRKLGDRALPYSTSQIATACRSEAIGSARLGMNSWATKPLKAGRDDRLHHRRIVDLLRLVDLVPARHAAGVEMGDVLDALRIVAIRSPSMICM